MQYNKTNEISNYSIHGTDSERKNDCGSDLYKTDSIAIPSS